MPRRGMLSHRMHHRCGECGGWTTNIGTCSRCLFARALPPSPHRCSGGCDARVEFEGSICLGCAAQDVTFVQAFARGSR